MSEPEVERKASAKLAEAAAWFAKMRGPDGPAHQAEFEAWLAADEDHRAQYNRAAEVFSLGKVLADGPPASASRFRRFILPVTAAAAILIAATVSITALREIGPRSAQVPLAANGYSQVLETAANERRRIRLGDGSLVDLEPATLLRFDFGSRSRRLFLGRGRARFQVAHERRPFIVYAGGGTVTAHGTIFDVSLSASREVAVRLVEGSIDVRPPATAGTASQRRLRPGESMSFRAMEAGPGPTAGNASEYVDVRLADLLAEANLKGSPKLSLADPSLGDKLVSGRFRIDNAEVLAERLSVLFGFVADRSKPGVIVLR